MKIKLTELELAKLKAQSESIKNLQMQMNQLQQQLRQYTAKQKQLESQIKDRVQDCPDVPIGRWDFSQVDWVNYEGEVIIPDEDEE